MVHILSRRFRRHFTRSLLLCQARSHSYLQIKLHTRDAHPLFILIPSPLLPSANSKCGHTEWKVQNLLMEQPANNPIAHWTRCYLKYGASRNDSLSVGHCAFDEWLSGVGERSELQSKESEEKVLANLIWIPFSFDNNRKDLLLFEDLLGLRWDCSSSAPFPLCIWCSDKSQLLTSGSFLGCWWLCVNAETENLFPKFQRNLFFFTLKLCSSWSSSEWWCARVGDHVELSILV